MRAPIERLREKVLKENLWIFILHTLTERPCYGAEMRALIKKKFGFLAGTVTAYKVLYLLEMGGYVKRKGKYYSITSLGREQLRQGEKFFLAILKDLKPIRK
jgi:DNA-binding PadR family transcriptional regulator